MSGRIGILGGTFDPIHFGHLAIAEEVRWKLDLARVFFVPAARQPFKLHHYVSGEDRLTMVRIASADDPGFAVCDLELQRGGSSYSFDTLLALKADYPVAEFFFVAGADVLADLARWYRVDELLTLCRFAILTRPGYPLDFAPVYRVLPAAQERLVPIEGPSLDISSTDLRARLAQGAPVRYQMPDPVIRYIEEHGLYRNND